ncbi:MAG: peptidylprolyl isomerase, partial [Bacteroides sp.]
GVMLLCWLGLAACGSTASDEEATYVKLDTSEGEVVLMLYNETPKHRDNFVSNVKKGIYDGASFNRVIGDFMVQCGEEEPEDVIPAEICYPKRFHKRGALAMGRCTDDKELKSAQRQFYIAWGKQTTDKMLQRDDSLMRAWSYGRCAMDSTLQEYYLTQPGIPYLDGSYTVFGEVVKGIEVIDRIQQQATDAHDRPLKKVTIRQAVLTDRPSTSDYWWQTASYVDAYRLENKAMPYLTCEGDSLYTIHDWYGVKGYDVQFVTEQVEDSTIIRVTNAERYASGYYYVKTGLPDLPTATIYPALFVETHTLCSGFHGDATQGRVWAYTYLYNEQREWKGGHLYTLMWGDRPEAPLWSVSGRCHLVGRVPDIETTLEAYSNRRYILRNWYGVEKYDLEFRLREDGGIEVLDYYWVENGCRYVQCRREDISTALIPQDEACPNGSLQGDAHSGTLRFKMTVVDGYDEPIPDPDHPEYIFEW